MGTTQENLQEAFAGESQANRRYIAFAAKADKDGYPQLARLFRATAEAETVHALKHFDVMGGVKTTAENLETAIGGEQMEFTTMYPGFIDKAEEERSQAARTSFAYANQVEKIHHSLYQAALEALKAGQKMKDEPYYVCQVCGNTVAGEAPDKCPICGSPRKMFKKVE
jgi:rubrerythrin